MTYIDVFNGDADGLCALHQLRLAEPVDSLLVTGVKRDIGLLARVDAGAGDMVTVCDISLSVNCSDLNRLLAAGATVRWFDHHHAGDIPRHPALTAHVDESPDVCTALLVDRHLAGAHRGWAITAAFGDNLTQVAQALGAAAGFGAPQLAVLRRLGECLNYNAYGDALSDLFYAPDALYRSMRGFADPLDYAAQSEAFRTLQAGRDDDLARAKSLLPLRQSTRAAVYLLPDADWSRRVRGALGNELAARDPSRAQAILTPDASQGYVVSVRVPRDAGVRADALCRGFDSGGGRAGAAGINHLPASRLGEFIDCFERGLSAGGSPVR